MNSKPDWDAMNAEELRTEVTRLARHLDYWIGRVRDTENQQYVLRKILTELPLLIESDSDVETLRYRLKTLLTQSFDELWNIRMGFYKKEIKHLQDLIDQKI